jgi:hypothetical protein
MAIHVPFVQNVRLKALLLKLSEYQVSCLLCQLFSIKDQVVEILHRGDYAYTLTVLTSWTFPTLKICAHILISPSWQVKQA